MTGVLLCNLSLNPTPFTFIPLTLLPVSDLINLKVRYDSPRARPPRIPFFLLIFLLTFLSDSAFLSRSFHTFLFLTPYSKPGGRLGCSHKASTVSPAASLPTSPSATVGVAERESERRSHLSPACPPLPHLPLPLPLRHKGCAS